MMSIQVKLDAGKDNSASVYLLLDPTSQKQGNLSPSAPFILKQR